MRILYVLPKLSNGGVEKMAEKWIMYLTRKDNICDVLAIEEGTNHVFSQVGCKVFNINISSLDIFGSYKKLKNFFRSKDHYDVVHSNVSFLNGLVCCVAKSECPGIITVSHAHTNGGGKYSSGASKVINEFVYSFYRLLIRNYSNFNLACSHNAGLYLYGKKIKFDFFPNAIDTDRFQFSIDDRNAVRDKYNLVGKNVYIHVGRFSKEKNHERLIEIFKSILCVDSESVLLLIGDGELKATIEMKVKESCLSSNVLFLGVQSDIARFYSAADCFLLPSFFEGFPVTIVEAQTNGLPCIVSDSIPNETAITDLVSFVSLNAGNAIWVDRCVHRDEKSRNSYADIVNKAGFNAEYSTNKLLKDYYVLQNH